MTKLFIYIHDSLLRILLKISVCEKKIIKKKDSKKVFYLCTRLNDGARLVISITPGKRSQKQLVYCYCLLSNNLFRISQYI